jgi:hypothetical protein
MGVEPAERAVAIEGAAGSAWLLTNALSSVKPAWEAPAFERSAMNSDSIIGGNEEAL